MIKGKAGYQKDEKTKLVIEKVECSSMSWKVAGKMGPKSLYIRNSPTPLVKTYLVSMSEGASSVQSKPIFTAESTV